MKKLLWYTFILSVICGGTFIVGSTASSPQIPFTLIKLDQPTKCSECNKLNHIVPCYTCVQKFRLAKPKVSTVPDSQKNHTSYFEPGVVTTHYDPQFITEYVFEDFVSEHTAAQRVRALLQHSHMYAETCLSSAAEQSAKAYKEAYAWDTSYEYKERKEYIELMKKKNKQALSNTRAQNLAEAAVLDGIVALQDEQNTAALKMVDERAQDLSEDDVALPEKESNKRIQASFAKQAHNQPEMKAFLMRAALPESQRTQLPSFHIRALHTNAIRASEHIAYEREQNEKRAQDFNNKRMKQHAFSAWKKAKEAALKTQADSFVDLTIQTEGLRDGGIYFQASQSAAMPGAAPQALQPAPAHQGEGAKVKEVPHIKPVQVKALQTLQVPDSGRSKSPTRTPLRVNPPISARGSTYSNLRVDPNASPLARNATVEHSPSTMALPSPVVAAVASPTVVSFGATQSNNSNTDRRSPSAAQMQTIMVQPKNLGAVAPEASSARPLMPAAMTASTALALHAVKKVRRIVANPAAVAPEPLGGAAAQQGDLPVNAPNGGAQSAAKYRADAHAAEDSRGQGLCKDSCVIA